VAMLADDFDVRVAASPDALDADTWLRREWALPPRERMVRDLSVREFDDLAVVSFLLDAVPSQRAGSVGATLFVVDVWRQSSGRLLARHVERPFAVPPRPPRPSGRE
jgi:hypothetical protein